MKKNKQLRYFKNTLIFEIISAVLVLAGFLIYWYSFEIWMLGTPLLVLGIAGLAVCFLLKVSDQGYTDYFNAKLDDMPRARELNPEYVAEEYSFEENHYGKLDKTGTPRSEIFVRTVLYFDKQLKVVCGMANAETEAVDIQTFLFDDAAAAVDTVERRVAGSLKKLSIMTITGSSGEAVSFPVKYNDIEIDDLAAKINKRYQK